MKLFIQIPCFNEEKTLPLVLNDLPSRLDGIDTIEVLVIDDGSTDGTAAVAAAAGVRHILKIPANRGLANAFMAGIEYCLRNGADIIVNTDADLQYRGQDIQKLVNPVLQNTADLVIGTRPIDEIGHFSPLKKFLQRMGSWVVRIVSHTNVLDAPSGFRAYSRRAAANLQVFNTYTYTIETIIQAGQSGMVIGQVPIGVNEQTRPSRLVKSIWKYVKQMILIILRVFVIYKPFTFFSIIGSITFLSGFVIGLRFLYFFIQGAGQGHIQSLILASVLLGMGFQTVLIAFLADMIGANRKMLQQIKANHWSK